MESTSCFAMCKTGFRSPVRLGIFDGFDDVPDAQWPSFLAVNTPFRARLATPDFVKQLLEASAVCTASAPLLFLLEEVPLLDQGVAHSSEMSICWVPKRANENLS